MFPSTVHQTRRNRQRFVFDLIFHEEKLIQTNELLTADGESAINFINDYFMGLDGEGQPGPDVIELRLVGEDEPVLSNKLRKRTR